MIYFDYIIISVIALVIGSFLNVFIWRIPQRQSIVFPASHCPKCGAGLKPKDLIPILSYILLRGKCRYCGVHISLRYPIIEVLNLILWLPLYYIYGLSVTFGLFAIVASTLLVLTVIDFQHQIIPDVLSLIILIISVVFLAKDTSMVLLYDKLIGFAVGGGSFLIILLLTGAMGDGDVVLMAVVGGLFGWKLILLTALLSFVIGAIVCLPMLLFKKKTGKSAVPFGPFIAISAYIVILQGEQLLNWYIMLNSI